MRVTVDGVYVLLGCMSLAVGLAVGGWRLAARVTRLIDMVEELTRQSRRLHRGHRRQTARVDALERRVDVLEARKR